MTRLICFDWVMTARSQRPDLEDHGKRRVARQAATAKERPVFESVLSKLQPDDTLVVWDVDRAFRSTVDAVQQAERLRERGVAFQIVNLGVDTATVDGMLNYTVIAALAEHERKRLSERTKEGLAAARRRGKRIGRPPKLSARQIDTIRVKLSGKESGVQQLADRYGVHPATIFCAMQKDGEA